MDLLHMIQTLIWETIKFLVLGVGVGYLLKKWVGDQIVKHWRRWLAQSERNTAIWLHYQEQALGKGHDTDDVLDCEQERCRIFHTYAS